MKPCLEPRISGNLLIFNGFIKERSLPETNLFKREFEVTCNLMILQSCNNYFNSITYLLDEFAPFGEVTRYQYKFN